MKEKKVKFGFVPTEWGDFLANAVEEIKLGEKLGFDSVWFEEHHEHERYLPNPISALGSLVNITKMKLGTAIAILPLYHPLRLAEEYAQLDRISHGRAIIGVAAGYRPKDFVNFGIDLKNRGKIMEEGLKLLDRLLTEESVTFSGKIFRLKDAIVEPKPFQKPRPPIWVGGWKSEAVKRAARYADAWFPGPVGTFAEVLKAKNVYEEELNRLGKAKAPLPLMRDAYITNNTSKSLEEARESLIYMYQQDYSTSSHPLVGGMSSALEEWAEDRVVIGSPDDAIDQIENFVKNGFNYFVLRLSLKQLKPQQILDCIRLFGEKVIPYFNDR
ncbi:MAG: LLM class flavin-dependent oxidoreductase [Candidatus Micrarchaeia archaeon]